MPSTKPPEPKTYTCRTCHKTYKMKKAFIAHKCKVKPKEEFVCEGCRKVYKLKSAFDKHKCPEKTQKFVCEHCKHEFMHERSFLIHVCEKKRRWMSKDDKSVRIGFSIFQKIWKRNTHSVREREYKDFVGNNLYKVLVAFGRYIIDINAINPEAFIEFLLRTEVKIDRWQSPVVYQTYIRELSKKETATAAVERNLLLMQQWALDTGEEWSDFFRKVATTQATLWISSGRISPWVLLLSPSAAELMGRLNSEQLDVVSGCISAKFWGVKLKVHAAEVAILREQLELAGL